MKPRMMSKPAMDHLFYHILDGFRTSHEGIIELQNKGIIADDEVAELVKKNSERLIDRIREFKLIQRLVCIFFALLFGYLQICGDDLEMRRRGGRSRRGGRRRNEIEWIWDPMMEE